MPDHSDRLQPGCAGLSGVSVLAVLAYDFQRLLPGGFVGMDILFVLCGYSICRVVDRRLRANTFSLLGFYRDCLRLSLPPLAAVILFCLAVSLLVFSPWETYRLGQSAAFAAVDLSNIVFLMRGSFFAERASAQPLLMTWAVSVTLQFAVVAPLVLLALKRSSRKITWMVVAALSGFSLVLCTYGEFHQHVWNFYLPFTRAWEFGAGGLLALSWTEPSRYKPLSGRAQTLLGALGVSVLLLCLLFYRPNMRFPGFEGMPPVLGAVMLLAAPDSAISRILATKPVRTFGLIAYSLYLWHWPLFSIASICSDNALPPISVAFVFVTSLVLATASWLLLERPFLEEPRLSALPGFLSYAVLAGAVAATGLFFGWQGVPAHSPALYKIEQGADLYRHFPCISSGSYLRFSPACTPNPIASESAIAILGGGHAEALASGLRVPFLQQGWQVITLTRESCPPLLGVSQSNPADSTLAASCRTFNREALHYILARPDVRAVMLVGRWRAQYVLDGSTIDAPKQSDAQNLENLKQGLRAEIASLEAAGKQVIIVEDTPEFPYDPVAGIRAQYMPMRRALNRMLHAPQPQQGDGSGELRSIAVSPDERRANDQVLSLRAEDSRLILVDPKQVLCDATRCRFIDGSDLLFADAIHISRIGALRLLPLVPELKTLRAVGQPQ